jgi:hypothetical protein
MTYHSLLHAPHPLLEEANDKHREWSAKYIDKFLRCIFGGAQYKVSAMSSLIVSRKPSSNLHP